MSNSVYFKEYLLGLTIGEFRKFTHDLPDETEMLILRPDGNANLIREAHLAPLAGFPTVILTDRPTTNQPDHV